VVGDLPYANWAAWCIGEFMPGRPEAAHIASMGCGAGELERQLFRMRAFAECHAYDIAEGALALARQRAHEEKCEGITYIRADMNTDLLPESAYDVVWFNSSLHHASALEFVCEQVVNSLRPGGLVFLNEYVGPSRFDFTRRQKQAIAAALTLIPRRYRRSFVPGGPEFQDAPPIPDPAEVAAVDPSESVRSRDILPVLDQYFEVLARRDAGGTILQFLLSSIAGNFINPDDREAQRVLGMLLEIERTLIATGDLESDFVVMVLRPKNRHTGSILR
jgi:SAM-dependent methyltransferase